MPAAHPRKVPDPPPSSPPNPHPRLALSLRAWLSSDNGILAGFAKPLDLLGSQKDLPCGQGQLPQGSQNLENSGHSQARPWKVQGCFLGRGEIPY